MGDQPGDGVNHDDLPAYLPGIVHSRAGSATPCSVIDSQQDGGVFHQKTVAVQHTIFVIVPADIDNRIGLLQDGAVEFPR